MSEARTHIRITHRYFDGSYCGRDGIGDVPEANWERATCRVCRRAFNAPTAVLARRIRLLERLADDLLISISRGRPDAEAIDRLADALSVQEGETE